MDERIPPGRLALFDNGFYDPRPEIRQLIDGPNHGPLGPAHYGWLNEPEFDYQLEALLHEVAAEHPAVIRVQGNDGRRWTRRADRFVLEGETDG